MSKLIPRLILFFCFAFLFDTFATGQNLTPKELTLINSNPDLPAITKLLTEKGFKQNPATNSGWFFYFEAYANSGEDVSALLRKSTDSSRPSKTTFFLYNPFHYKEFISNLTKAKYKFKGTQVIDNNSYFVFENKQTVFVTRETRDVKKQAVFEIIVHSK